MAMQIFDGKVKLASSSGYFWGLLQVCLTGKIDRLTCLLGFWRESMIEVGLLILWCLAEGNVDGNETSNKVDKLVS